ncbi:MAG: beta-ketoacyl-ACP synthase II [Eubacteriales bacterium]|nr:beta-ketoacyl-ACP synthase II [Eubacteriales bacterium]
MNKRRVVVTGAGVVTSMGIGTDRFWEAVRAGKSGIGKVTRFDTSDLPTKTAAEVNDFDPKEYIDKKEIKRMDMFTQFALAATRMAVESSGINIASVNKESAGVIVGSGIGGIQTLEEQHDILNAKGAGRISPFFIPMMIGNISAGRIAIEYGFKGFNECVVTACATSNNAIGDALRVIQRGEADIMITGGSEAPLTKLAFAGFCSQKAMSAQEDPLIASRPFDRERDGFVMGEGAGILLLEEYGHAVGRGAPILGEIKGYSCTCDAYHITAPHPDGDGGMRCMRLALKDAGITPEEVGYINAHGTATIIGDPIEVKVVKSVFGENAYKVPFSSTKSMTGHLLGAAGAVEAIISLLAIRDGYIPPTIALEHPDPECDLDHVPLKGRNADIKYVVSNSMGFGGHNATLVLAKV